KFLPEFEFIFSNKLLQYTYRAINEHYDILLAQRLSSPNGITGELVFLVLMIKRVFAKMRFAKANLCLS
ncbi:TPA: hypothetical protein ACGAP6_002558, partial [Legionella pneumophila]